MTFSLMSVFKKNSDGTIQGNWIQDHIGTLETAIETAKATEATNGNKIDVAVVDSKGWRGTGEHLDFQKRLDTQRNRNTMESYVTTP